MAVVLGELAETPKGTLVGLEGLKGLKERGVLAAAPPATVKPDRFDESEAGVPKVFPEAPRLFLSRCKWVLTEG
jgi:hypothetical protein